MTIPNFKDLLSMSNAEICEKIIQTENELFNLRFKKATQQPFKPHEFKCTRRRLAHLKTLLTLRLDSLETKQNNVLNDLVIKKSI